MPEQAFATIKVKLGHPTGEYRRGGHVFTMAEPVILPADEVTLEMMTDDWLIVSFDADAPVEGLKQMTRDALDAHALTLGIDTSDAKNKDEAIERIKAATPVAPVDASAKTIEDLQVELTKVTAERDGIQHQEIMAAKTELDAMRVRAEKAEEQLAKLTGATTATNPGVSHQVNSTPPSGSGSPHDHQTAPSVSPKSGNTPGDGSDKSAGSVSGESTVNPVNSTTVPPASGPGAKS